MKTLTILLLLAATNFMFAGGMQQDLTDCAAGSANNTFEQSFESEPSSSSSSSSVATLGQ